MKMTGAELIIRLLERQGITTVAGIPGGVLDMLAGLLGLGGSLIPPAFGLESLVVGGIADGFLDLAADLDRDGDDLKGPTAGRNSRSGRLLERVAKWPRTSMSYRLIWMTRS